MTSSRLKQSVLCTVAVVALGVAQPAMAAQFSADVVMTEGGRTMTGKIYISGDNMRQDSSIGGMKNSVIVNSKQKKMWMLVPAQKAYMEMDLSKSPGQAAQITNPADMQRELRKVAHQKKLGSEKVNGHMCDKSQWTFKDKTKGTMLQWTSKKLKFPIKMVTNSPQGKATIVYKNVSTKKIAASLFKVPAGYKKMDVPAGMAPPAGGR